jgi:putative transposase
MKSDEMKRLKELEKENARLKKIAEDVIGTLERLFGQRGAPAFIRSDNGPEFEARVLEQWLALSEVETLYIEPGSPWRNAYVESFIGRFGDELLKREAFADLIEAKVLVEEYPRAPQPPTVA